MPYPETKDSPIAIGKRVKSARLLSGLSRKEFNTKYNISSATLRSWELPKGIRSGLTEKGAHRFVMALSDEGVNCSINWLMKGEGASPTLKETKLKQDYDLQSIGWSEDEIIFREVEFFKEINPSPIVFLVSDRAMEPIFNRGNYVGGNKVYNEDIKNLVGLNCIVETIDNEIYVRRLERGVKEGLYTLTCLNPIREVSRIVINDILLKSAAEIIWYRKRSA